MTQESLENKLVVYKAERSLAKTLFHPKDAADGCYAGVIPIAKVSAIEMITSQPGCPSGDHAEKATPDLRGTPYP